MDQLSMLDAKDQKHRTFEGVLQMPVKHFQGWKPCIASRTTLGLSGCYGIGLISLWRAFTHARDSVEPFNPL